MASPIEIALLSAIADVAPALGVQVAIGHRWRSFDERPVEHPDDRFISAPCDPPVASLVVWTEAMLHGYRADLYVCFTHDDRMVQAIVECDGHDWHERTQQQAAYDRARDRALLREGLPTIRFTGSEIHRDANQCAREVLETLRAMLTSQWRDIASAARALAEQWVQRAVEQVAEERAAQGGEA